jgi:hypothetical protein
MTEFPRPYTARAATAHYAAQRDELQARRDAARAAAFAAEIADLERARKIRVAAAKQHAEAGERCHGALASATECLADPLCVAIHTGGHGDLLIGEAARPKQRKALRESVVSDPEVDQVIELLTMYVVFDSMLIVVRVDLGDVHTSDEVEQLADRIDADLREVEEAVTEVVVNPTPVGAATGVRP